MDMKQIKELMKEFDESGITRMKITQEHFEFEVEKAVATATVLQAAPLAVAPIAAPTTTAAVSAPILEGDAILSPMVGTFYASPSPEASAFVKVGDRIKKGQVVAIMEAMKIMNEIEAEFDCIIKELLATDGQAVEYDMAIFAVEKI